MTDIKLLLIYAVAMAAFIGWGLWNDRHARRRRKMFARMTAHFDALTLAVGGAMVPAFTQATAAVDEFVRTWNETGETS